jgi:hypothetical protein
MPDVGKTVLEVIVGPTDRNCGEFYLLTAAPPGTRVDLIPSPTLLISLLSDGLHDRIYIDNI